MTDPYQTRFKQVADSEIKNLKVVYGFDGPQYELELFLFEQKLTVTVGNYRKIALSKARELSRKVLNLAQKGIHPCTIASEKSEDDTSVITVEKACYLLQLQGHFGDYAQCEFIATHLIPGWGYRRLEKLSCTDIEIICNQINSAFDSPKPGPIEVLFEIFSLAYGLGALSEEHPMPMSTHAPPLCIVRPSVPGHFDRQKTKSQVMAISHKN